MSQQTTLVIGEGEIGLPIAEILSSVYNVITKDIDPIPDPGEISVLHICYPFQIENFVEKTGSYYYKEDRKVPIKNIISSSFTKHSASYQQKTFISKIGIYDEDKNLIAIAKLATPVAKTSEQDYTFKLKLDI